MKRKSGILMPVTSIPSPYGIGCFSKEAYGFVNFLKKAGQTYWQILPLGQTSYGDSPYQSFSTFAGNPYFIDLDEFVKRRYLKKADLLQLQGEKKETCIDYGLIYQNRYPVLEKAYHNSPLALGAKAGNEAERALQREFEDFIDSQKSWLYDYALYSAIKVAFGGKSWIEWDEDIRLRKPEALKRYAEEYADQIRSRQFQQFFFARQWKSLRKYANDLGIRIIGDLPIYVAFDSADTWASPELFYLDEEKRPVKVAGCPPDGFSATGQLWGNPLYRWDYHKETGYDWWMRRLRQTFELYDITRIDHFRGFDEYYAIPAGDATAENGKWMQGPGKDFIDAIKKNLGNCPIIAEDLGFLTPTVLELVKYSGYPGMKVLQFAFDSREASDYLPHNYHHNCVVYTGTHDNDTMTGWCKNVNRRDFRFSCEYLGISSKEAGSWNYIRCALSTVADTAIIPIQDYLELGSKARINTPSTLGGNWQWRLRSTDLNGALAGKIRRMTQLYGRC